MIIIGSDLFIGPLAGVSNLTTGDLIPGRSTLLSWVSPFSLDVTNVEPDITYCVDVYMYNDTMRHQIRSTCGVTATAYNVTFNEGEVTPCDIVNITVIPVNGQPNRLINGTERYVDSVYMFEGSHHATAIDIATVNSNTFGAGIGNFPANDVIKHSREVTVDTMEVNLQLPVSFGNSRYWLPIIQCF